jgi:hypothetical protein
MTGTPFSELVTMSTTSNRTPQATPARLQHPPPRLLVVPVVGLGVLVVALIPLLPQLLLLLLLLRALLLVAVVAC